MSKVIASKDKKNLSSAGLRIDRIIHKHRRERDLRINRIKYVRKGNHV
jgi:hypothetical protein